jgi:hypothetical protein
MKSYPRIPRIKAGTWGKRERGRERRRSWIADVANDEASRSGIDEEKPEIQVGRDRCGTNADPSGRQIIIFG